MESNLKHFKKIFVVSLIIVFAASLTVGQNLSYAQTAGIPQGGGPTIGIDDQGRRTETTTIGTVQTGQTITTVTINPDGTRTQTQQVTAPQSVSSAGAGAVGTCLVGQTLANAVSSAVSSLLSAGATALASVITVPVNDAVTNIQTGQTAANNIAQTSKEVGIPIWGVPILPSLDSIGYCLVNSLIEYISDATIAWINSGFEGNPVFIDNFDEFFKNIADRELAAFMNNLTLPGYMCEPFQVNIQLGLLNDRSNQRDRFNQFRGTGSSSSTGFNNAFRNQCGLETFLNGGAFAGTGFSGGGGFGVSSAQAFTNNYPGLGASGGGGDVRGYYEGNTETVESAGFVGFLLAGNPQNHSLGAFNAARQQVAIRQQASADINRTEIQTNDGVISPRDEDGNIQTPGKIIQAQIEKRLGLDEDRLVLAREFDEVVSALVDALIKIALDEILPNGSQRFLNVSVDGRDVRTQQQAQQNPGSITADIDVTGGN